MVPLIGSDVIDNSLYLEPRVTMQKTYHKVLDDIGIAALYAMGVWYWVTARLGPSEAFGEHINIRSTGLASKLGLWYTKFML